jgi:ribosomal protein S21
MLRNLATAHSRETLYSSRRFPVSRAGGLPTALRNMRASLDTEQVFEEVRARRYMRAPCEDRNMGKFFRRQSEFKEKVTRHVQKIMEIEESLK